MLRLVYYWFIYFLCFCCVWKRLGLFLLKLEVNNLNFVVYEVYVISLKNGIVEFLLRY